MLFLECSNGKDQLKKFNSNEEGRLVSKVITVKELAKKVVNHEETFILDVRNTDEFDDWKIEGGNVEIINEPYFNFLYEYANY